MLVYFGIKLFHCLSSLLLVDGWVGGWVGAGRLVQTMVLLIGGGIGGLPLLPMGWKVKEVQDGITSVNVGIDFHFKTCSDVRM